MNALTLALLISVTGGAGDEIASSLVDQGIRKIGVIPSVISRKGDHESTVGSLGPRALTMARDLQDELVYLSTTGAHRGKFSVVSDRVMKHAIKEANLNRQLTVDDLGNPNALEALSELTGAEAFVTLDTDEEASIVETNGSKTDPDDDDDKDKGKDKDDGGGANFKPVTKLNGSVVGKDGTEWSTHKFLDYSTLSGSAYSGTSFEIRRWDGDKLRNEGISTPHPQLDDDTNWMFGKDKFDKDEGQWGEEWERVHFNNLKTSLDHPLDIDGFPYEVTIKVDGRVRKPERLRGEYVLALEDEEEYSIELTNDTDQPALVALYVDGISTIDKELREPRELENARHWVLKPNYTGAIDGWYTLDEDKEKPQKANRFKIVPRDESVAGQKGFDGKIGMITAIFYVNDAASGKLIDYPADSLLDGLKSGIPTGAFGTGLGKKFEQKLNFVKARRGPLLAALTIYYRTQQEIDDIRSGKSEDHRLAIAD
ncbi:MAG: hypothetical protein RIC55_35840 [Pirellulaceae bacterium]